MEKVKKERRIYGVIEEVLIDPNGNVILPGQEPEYEEPVQEPVVEPVQEPIEEVVEEPVQEEVVEEVAEEVQEEPVQEEVVEEVAEEVAEEVQEEPAQEEAPELAIADLPESDKPKFIAKTFAQKMLDSDEVLQDRYDELKNYALRFKKLKARISRKFDSINKGRLQFVKLSVAGKTLKLYLNMDIDTVDTKFHCKDVSDKKTYVTVPVLLRIKSGRAVKYAKLLIDQCAEFHGLVENKKFQEVDAMALIEESLNNGDEDVENVVDQDVAVADNGEGEE